MFTLSVCLLLLPGVFSQLIGWVSSPEYPLNYPNHISMNWTECAPAGLSVSLTLIHLDLENSTLCEHDALMIFTDQHLKMSLCGSMSFAELQLSVNPHLLSSSGGCLSIYFHSDDSLPQSHTGFSALYQTQDVDECTGENNPCSHLCYNFIGGFCCNCPHGYVLNHNNHSCEAINCGDPKPLLNGHVQFIKGSNNEYLSVIQYHCNEPFYTSLEIQNVTRSCGADQKWRKENTSMIPSCLPVCGHHDLVPAYGRIFGGLNAQLGSFPWQVFLQLQKSYRAGAFIIGEKWIMTAAHNLNSYSTTLSIEDIMAYVGHNNYKEKDKFIALNISSVYIHPQYNNSDGLNFDNDIALIKLNTPITFSEKVRPLCLPPEAAEKVYSGWVSGFGLSSRDFSKPETILQYVQLPVVDEEICKKSIEYEKKGKRILKNIPPITDNMFCAGFEEGEKDACHGDSGSAFVAEKDGVHWAMGIVSWGLDCGKKGLYGIYTRIPRYLDWINMIMREN
ncbi:mannan-binding lectin serine protease 2-like isoform X2 [Hoplias malabaricus]|uniref:mannan-binding lectin serine protease 2-like isoform X2 n=1 Tax=Hoplias malabaricus TaxID=27720 RepID=UPI003462C899